MLHNPNKSVGNKARILYIDPDIVSYYLVLTILNKYDIDIIHIKTGPDAIRWFEENSLIEGVITEIKVPGIDGFGILKKIRKINPQISVIVQTAYVHNNMMKKCREAGFNNYLSKPIDIKQFINVVEKSILSIEQS